MNDPFALTPLQEAVTAVDGSSFILGPAGTGKTTALQHRLLRLLAAGEPAYTMLVLVAEPEARQSYLETLHHARLGPYADLTITTYTHLAQELVALFWPLLARDAGFARPYQPPTFLSYDLAQLLMWYTVSPLFDEGAFSDLRLRPQQVVSQLLDTLNRAALNGLPLPEAIERQMNTWVGEPDRLRHLADAATAVTNFRRACYQNSLLDLSLAVEVFDTRLVQHPEFHRYFSERYRHLLIDNIEEQTPAGQNFVSRLMPLAVTTAIAYDAGGGYKRFMAADPLGANRFHSASRHVYTFQDSFVSRPALTALANVVENHLLLTTLPTQEAATAVSKVINGRYRRDMIAQLVVHLDRLVNQEQIPPAQIAIIAPYLDGALRYMLTQALSQAGLPYFLLRRRSSPREEPRVRAWLTWLALARPQWQMPPSAYDVAEALALSIAGLDPARAALLAQYLYAAPDGRLQPTATLPDHVAGRIGEYAVQLVEELRLWLDGAAANLPIDAFLFQLFNDLLAQPRFQPEPDLAGAAICDWLVQAATRLRQAAAVMGLDTETAVGVAFIDGIYQGLVTANPPDLGEPPDPNGLMISTIYGYLLAGRPAAVQVWLETAATGWWDIPKQPLSNAFVLAQSRNPHAPWTTDEEFAMRNQLLSRIVRGLTNRCTGHVILANSDLDRRGLRQEGPLWRALQPVRGA